MTRRVLLLASLALVGGCLLPARPEPSRFFSPGSALLDAASAGDVGPPVAAGVPVRLRTIRADPFLRERIVWRASEVEYGLYEQRRWIDLPAHYVARALAARLATTPGVRLTNDARAVALHVDVLAFDDVVSPAHAAAVGLAVRLDDPARGPVLDRTFEARVPIADGDPVSMAKAMGVALDDAVAQVADAVRTTVKPRGGGR
jgi:ABC-type uncharacterized transport system auxiliary subunit